jgi:hypothetical protein
MDHGRKLDRFGTRADYDPDGGKTTEELAPDKRSDPAETLVDAKRALGKLACCCEWLIRRPGHKMGEAMNKPGEIGR